MQNFAEGIAGKGEKLRGQINKNRPESRLLTAEQPSLVSFVHIWLLRIAFATYVSDQFLVKLRPIDQSNWRTVKSSVELLQIDIRPGIWVDQRCLYLWIIGGGKVIFKRVMLWLLM